jgi:2'-phosphotransferase
VIFPDILDTIKTNKRLFMLQYIPSAEAKVKSMNNDQSSLLSEKSDSVPTNKGQQDRDTITATALAASTSDQDPTHYLILVTQSHRIRRVGPQATPL